MPCHAIDPPDAFPSQSTGTHITVRLRQKMAVLQAYRQRHQPTHAHVVYKGFPAPPEDIRFPVQHVQGRTFCVALPVLSSHNTVIKAETRFKYHI
jgi:hypothetical protein